MPCRISAPSFARPTHICDRGRSVYLSLPLGVQSLQDVLSLLPRQFLLPALVQSHRSLFDPFEGLLFLLDAATGPHPVLGRLALDDMGTTVHRFAPEAAHFAFGVQDFVSLEMALEHVSVGSEQLFGRLINAHMG
jgi:hypothetical protein